MSENSPILVLQNKNKQNSEMTWQRNKKNLRNSLLLGDFFRWWTESLEAKDATMPRMGVDCHTTSGHWVFHLAIGRMSRCEAPDDRLSTLICMKVIKTAIFLSNHLLNSLVQQADAPAPTTHRALHPARIWHRGWRILNGLTSTAEELTPQRWGV